MEFASFVISLVEWALSATWRIPLFARVYVTILRLQTKIILIQNSNVNGNTFDLISDHVCSKTKIFENNRHIKTQLNIFEQIGGDYVWEIDVFLDYWYQIILSKFKKKITKPEKNYRQIRWWGLPPIWT